MLDSSAGVEYVIKIVSGENPIKIKLPIIPG